MERPVCGVLTKTAQRITGERTVNEDITEETIDQWVDEHAGALLKYAQTRLRDTRLAEEAVQDTFVAAWKGRDSFRAQSAVRTWLIGILRKKTVDQLRKNAREAGPAPEEDAADWDALFADDGHYKTAVSDWGATPDREYERGEFWQCLNGCLECLPERLAKVFVLREIDGLETAEICDTLGITANNLWVTLHRARIGLRECMQRSWFDAAAQEASHEELV